MRNVSHKSCRGNQDTILCSVTFSRKSWRLREDVAKYGTVRQATCDNTIHFRKSCTKVDTLIIFNTAFPLQQQLREHSSMLCCMYIASSPPGPPTCLISSTLVLFTLHHSPSVVTDFFRFTLPFEKVYGPIKPQRLFRCSSNLSHRSAPFIHHVTLYTNIYLALKWTVTNFHRFNLTHTFTANTEDVFVIEGNQAVCVQR
jgi:hypothetical protein